MIGKSTNRQHEVSITKWLRNLALVLAITTLVLEYGFKTVPIGQICLHAAQVLAVFLIFPEKIREWVQTKRQSSHWPKPGTDTVLLLVLGLSLCLLPVIVSQAPASATRWATFHGYLLILVLMRIVKFSVAAATTGWTPTRLLLVNFATAILIGAFLLMLPLAHRTTRVSFTDAVFTATSATCVTGLVVLDTGRDFTRLGQTVILVMIQVGGLGIMIFGALFALLLASHLTLRESVAMQDVMHDQSPRHVRQIIVFIFISTLAVEALGAVGLYGMWLNDEFRGGQLFNSIFHSVSAFCNAGFCTQEFNLQAYHDRVATYAVICPLIVLGGLGFPVLYNLWSMARRHYWRPQPHAWTGRIRLSLHSKIALSTSVALVLGGWILLITMEWTRAEGSHTGSAAEVCLNALFNSVTARTAGFSTIDIDTLTPGAKLILTLLMFIGGSPSSTAGGIKTVTFAVMVLAVYATMRRRSHIQVFHRSISVMTLRRAATLTLVYGLLLWLMTMLLTITERSYGPDLLDLVFETTSAMGTVGLSTGLTNNLTIAGKWVIIAAMFVGRVGPLSLLMALTFNAPPAYYEYPEEPLVVG